MSAGEKLFEYTATAPGSSESTGRARAESMEALRWQLREDGLRLVGAREVSGEVAVSRGGWIPFAGRVRSVDLELALRQVVVMLKSGMTLLAALETVIEQAPSRGVGRLFTQVRDEIESGASFADALAEQRSVPSTVVAMVSIGEESGNLDTVLARSAVSLESKRRLLNSTLTALFYPVITVMFAVAICIYMIVAVIPPMKRALEALGRKLPPMTQSLVDLAEFFQRFGIPLAAGAFVFACGAVALWIWPPGRLAIDRAILRVPLIGLIQRTAATSLFSRTLSTLLSSGIPLVDGLRVLQSIIHNRQLVAIVNDARQRILGGSSFADAIQRPYAFMPMMNRMISVGETSGNLEETLENVAEFHEEQLEALIKRLSALIEPAIILVVGFIVGYVYIAFFMGLYGTVN